MTKPTYVAHRLAERTPQGNLWHTYVRYSDQASSLLGFSKTRKAAITVLRLMAGPRGRVEVIEKPYEGDAWRLPA